MMKRERKFYNQATSLDHLSKQKQLNFLCFCGHQNERRRKTNFDQAEKKKNEFSKNKENRRGISSAGGRAGKTRHRPIDHEFSERERERKRHNKRIEALSCN